MNKNRNSVGFSVCERKNRVNFVCENCVPEFTNMAAICIDEEKKCLSHFFISSLVFFAVIVFK